MRVDELNIQILQRDEIDSIRWDELVAQSVFAHPSLRSAYLDTVCPQWSAAVMGDMFAAMPVSLKRKWGIWYASMPPFVQQTGCISPLPMSIDPFLHCIMQKVRFAEISANETDCTELSSDWRNNYCLAIDREYRFVREHYNENTKRNIAKANSCDLHLRQVADPLCALVFFKENNLKNKLNSTHFHILNRLIGDESNGLSKCYEIVDSKYIPLAMSIFTVSMNRHVYTLASLTERGRMCGAMFALIDRYIQMHCGNEGQLLDFEGSNIAGVAQFYAGFGAVNRPYPFVKINNLPWPLRLLKH